MGVLQARRLSKDHTRRCHLRRSPMLLPNLAGPATCWTCSRRYLTRATHAGCATHWRGLAVAVTAVLAGARSFAAIGEWAADLPGGHLTRIGLASCPDESTLRKLFARLDADRLDRVLGAWLWTRSEVVHGQRVIALDGKTVRGARTATRTAPHLVAALDHTSATVIGQVATAAKSNEIPAVRGLLACFDLTGVVVTVDAMHTQSETATAITSAGGTYVFTVKGNTPTLHRQLKTLPWKEVPAHSATVTSHGRRATRTIKSVTAPAWVGFAGAAQVAQIRRTVTAKGRRAWKWST